jgi:hypothetical protein
MAQLEAYLYSESVTDDTLPSLVADDTIVVTEGAVTCAARLGEPLRFTAAMAKWGSELSAVLPGFYQVTYSASTNRVTISSTHAFTLVLPGNMCKVLGFEGAFYGPGLSFTGELAPAVIVQLAGYSCAPADDAAKVELRSFRHARSLAIGWGNVQLFNVGIVLRASDVPAIMPRRGTDASGYCLTGRIRVGPTAPAYSPTAPGGYLDGWIVQTSELSTLGDDENFVTLSALVAVA